ncbi:MAG: hypothetical protein JSW58_05230 [Candidatus Latescibacterota bacterium]|nr:MAG: hypothetical protein JSW58_05230 [Candidatus Latescibacterota bacterium]
MLYKKSHKSSEAAPAPADKSLRFPPSYGFVGLGIMVLGEIALFSGVGLVARWFTPIMWTGYILFTDSLIRRRKGTSLLSRYPLEFFLLAVISIGSWVIFEAYNVLLKNWRYVGLPENMLVRYFGYAWSFATISPGMFLTYELLESYLPGTNPARSPRLGDGLFYGFVVCGLGAVIVPLIWPSTYMTPLVWLGLTLLIDPINQRLGERSFVSEFFAGRFRAPLTMFLAGLICGLLWEFWNYWADTKWQYDVPYLGDVKLFEMPVLGFLGFMPFGVESYAIYVFVRRLIPIPRQVRYLG